MAIMPRGIRYVFLALILLLIGSVPLAMQFDTGSIVGTVVDEAGPVVNASVEARNLISGAQAQAGTDQTGRYVLSGLRQGRYSMWVRAPRHDSVWLAHVVVASGQTAVRDVFLRRLETGPTITSVR